ncbi:mismatch repair protein MSH, putative, partial [Bodo saltans]
MHRSQPHQVRNIVAGDRSAGVGVFRDDDDIDDDNALPQPISLPGGIVVVFPAFSSSSSSSHASGGLFGVCVFDVLSRTVRCCSVAEPSTTALDSFDAVDEEDHQERSTGRQEASELEEEDNGAFTSVTDPREGSADAPPLRFGLSHHWLAQIFTSLSPSETTLCRPVAPLPDHIEEVVVEFVTRRGGTVKMFYPKSHAHIDGLISQLTLLWPDIPVSAWHSRLSLLHVREDVPIVNTPLVTVLSVMLDTLVRTNQRVLDVREEPAASFVHMDHNTMHALRVFRSDAHPCGYQGIGGGYKEGFSLFAFFAAYTTTSLGRELLRRWMLSPTNSIPELHRRQILISLFGAVTCRDVVVKQLSAALRHVKHPGRTTYRFQSLRHGRSDYVDLARSATSLLALRSLLLKLGDIVASGSAWQEADTAATAAAAGHQTSREADGAAVSNTMQMRKKRSSLALATISGWVQQIDIDAATRLVDVIRNNISLAPTNTTTASNFAAKAGSSAAGGGPPSVLPGVDGELDELRAHYARLGPYLTQVAEELALSLPQDAYSSWKLSCVFYPRVGYLIGVNNNNVATGDAGGGPQHPSNTAMPVGGGGPLLPHVNNLPFGWELVFETPGMLYCRTPHTKELDATIGDIHSAVIQRECAVRLKLDEQIVSIAPCVMPLVQIGAEVDVFLALSSVCCGGVEGGSAWCCPSFIDAEDHLPTAISCGACSSISVDHAYHPLLSKLCSAQSVVPMHDSFHARVHQGRLSIFTGPNGSGKTIAMQSVLLCVYLAHIGCYVPASSCTLSTVDRIVFISDGAAGGGGGSRTSWRRQPSTNFSSAHTSAAATTTTEGSAARQLHEACGGSSTFAQELLAVNRVFTQCTARSFVVLDEFGRGTLAADGVALLASFLLSTVIDVTTGGGAVTLQSTTVAAPVILLATHYTEILAPSIGLMTSPLVQHVRMSFVVPLAPPRSTTSETMNRNISTDAAAVDPFATGVVFPFRFIVELGGVGNGDFSIDDQQYQAGSSGTTYTAYEKKTKKRHYCSLALNCAAMCEVPEYMLARMAALLTTDENTTNAEPFLPYPHVNNILSCIRANSIQSVGDVHAVAAALLMQLLQVPKEGGGDTLLPRQQETEEQLPYK